MRVPLRENGVVTLNGLGAGVVKLGPLTAREVWYAESASVKVSLPTGQSMPTNEAACVIYVGTDTTQTNFRDNTYSGSSGDSSDKVAGKISRGMYVWAVWTGGDAGQQATLTLSGDKDI